MKVIKISYEGLYDLDYEVKEVENTLEELQSEVEGYIETLYLGNGFIIICNEEGRLKHLPVTLILENGIKREDLVGNILICKVDEENFASLSEEDINLIMNNARFKNSGILELSLFNKEGE